MIVCPAADGTAAAAMAAPAAQTVPAAAPAPAAAAVKVAENAAQSCAAVVDYFIDLFMCGVSNVLALCVGCNGL